jgi:hypothetical protein
VTDPLTRWGYKIVQASARRPEDLDVAGREGWEAVGMDVTGAALIVLLKRPLAMP